HADCDSNTRTPRLTPYHSSTQTATTLIHPLSLHDALPISHAQRPIGSTTRRSGKARLQTRRCLSWQEEPYRTRHRRASPLGLNRDRKSTRLNSSHGSISYAVFCLKKKNTTTAPRRYDAR